MAPRPGCAELLVEAPAKRGRIGADEAGAKCSPLSAGEVCMHTVQSIPPPAATGKERTPQVEEGCLDACVHFLALTSL